jgi:AraC-like DNA-binding protein
MPRSIVSVFTELDDFQAALREDGISNLLVTSHGQFYARLTQIRLHRLRLSAGDECLARIAFVAVPPDGLLVSLPGGDRPAPICGGMETRAGEMITLGPGQRLHARSDGPCRWNAIQLPAEELAEYRAVLKGAASVVPTVARWRPPRAALRQLRHFHHAAVRTAKTRSEMLADSDAAHGLEQQLIHALIECLSAGPVAGETPAARRQRAILAQFEAQLEAEPVPGITEISAALGISGRLLRECCKSSLGMSPTRYRRLRCMQRVHRALLAGDPATTRVGAVAERHGAPSTANCRRLSCHETRRSAAPNPYRADRAQNHREQAVRRVYFAAPS